MIQLFFDRTVYRTPKRNLVKGLGFKEDIRYDEGGMPLWYILYLRK